MKRITTALALLLVLPAVAAAQEPEHPHEEAPAHHADMAAGHHAGMEAMGPGMMAMMMEHPGPGMILRLRETLGLAEEQVERLEALHSAAREEMHTHMQAAAEARQRAHAAMQGDSPDLAAHEAALREAADHTVQARQSMARVHVEAGEVLSAEQRATLDTILGAMREMHQGREGMGSGVMRPHPQGMRPRRDGGAGA